MTYLQVECSTRGVYGGGREDPTSGECLFSINPTEEEEEEIQLGRVFVLNDPPALGV